MFQTNSIHAYPRPDGRDRAGKVSNNAKLRSLPLSKWAAPMEQIL
ncbi:hypothetical protein QA601_18930 [Chitinispirillales bacterium ANBcel5]|nr:hypothetical protein [Chitinispirillales bacterium ANBcel5]